jgi:hypothetical protein
MISQIDPPASTQSTATLTSQVLPTSNPSTSFLIGMMFRGKCSDKDGSQESQQTPRSNVYIRRIMKLFVGLSYYLIIGTLYCWMTVLVEKLLNIYAEVVFYPIRTFPNCTRIVIVLTAVMLRHYTLAILTAMCFFGEIIWARRDVVMGSPLWNFGVFGFSTCILILLYRLVMNTVGQWLREREYMLART